MPLPSYAPSDWRPGRCCPGCTGTRHRSWRRVAGCRWRRACWIVGNPPAEGPCFALLAWCRVLTVTLWETWAEAEAALADIDRGRCGGQCHRDHEIVVLGVEPAGFEGGSR
jgi:hypothetical protein